MYTLINTGAGDYALLKDGVLLSKLTATSSDAAALILSALNAPVRAGAAKSAAKAAASKVNGAKGGRPRKQLPGG